MNIKHATWRGNVITGMWKFAAGVSPQVLATIAAEWKQTSPERYGDIHVRSWGRDKFAICFSYVAPRAYPKRLYIKNIKMLIEVAMASHQRSKDDLLGWDIVQGIWDIN